MKGLMEGLGTQMAEVRVDIKDVRKDLGEEIAKGAKATDDLRRRMDENDSTFAARVVAVLRDQDGQSGAPGNPVFPSASQSALVSGIAKDAASNDPGMSYAACAGLPPRPPRQTKEDTYWLC